ncbi:MAG: hypothetical protein SNH73_03135 [Rikenellaceae bacterium]
MKGFLAGLLLLILSAYYVNSSMMYHQHTIQGETIFHSHFYSESHTTSSDDGGHTVAVIKLISLLSVICFEDITLFWHLDDALRVLEAVVRIGATSEAHLFIEGARSLRAPPIL